jgi:CRP/FNR family transcriptional regulator
MASSSACPTVPARPFNVCGSLDCVTRSKLFEFGAQRRWARDQMLFTAGKPITTLHRVVSGVLARSIALSNGRRQIVDFLFPGDICGLVQSNGSHLFDCEAITDATTRAIAADCLRKSVGSPGIGKVIDDEVMRAVKRTAEHLVTIAKFGTGERLWHILLWLEKTYAERGLPTHPLALPMSRSDIGDYLGMESESVSRAFAVLKKRDLISLISAEQVVLRGQRWGEQKEELEAALRNAHADE